MVHKTYFKSISWISTSKNAAEIQPRVKNLYVRQQDSMRWYRQCLISTSTTTLWSPGHFGLCLCCPTARWLLLRRHSWQDQARPGEVGTNWIQSNSDFVQDFPNILLILCMGDSSQNEAPVRHLSLCRITTRSCTKSLMLTQCSQINPSTNGWLTSPHMEHMDFVPNHDPILHKMGWLSGAPICAGYPMHNHDMFNFKLFTNHPDWCANAHCIFQTWLLVSKGKTTRLATRPWNKGWNFTSWVLGCVDFKSTSGSLSLRHSLPMHSPAKALKPGCHVHSIANNFDSSGHVYPLQPKLCRCFVQSLLVSRLIVPPWFISPGSLPHKPQPVWFLGPRSEIIIKREVMIGWRFGLSPWLLPSTSLERQAVQVCQQQARAGAAPLVLAVRVTSWHGGMNGNCHRFLISFGIPTSWHPAWNGPAFHKTCSPVGRLHRASQTGTRLNSEGYINTCWSKKRHEETKPNSV